ncbi:hypothetical protein RI367_008634 [Sorochytrium milnesiophthora]
MLTGASYSAQHEERQQRLRHGGLPSIAPTPVAPQQQQQQQPAKRVRQWQTGDTEREVNEVKQTLRENAWKNAAAAQRHEEQQEYRWPSLGALNGPQPPSVPSSASSGSLVRSRRSFSSLQKLPSLPSIPVEPAASAEPESADLISRINSLQSRLEQIEPTLHKYRQLLKSLGSAVSGRSSGNGAQRPVKQSAVVCAARVLGQYGLLDSLQALERESGLDMHVARYRQLEESLATLQFDKACRVRSPALARQYLHDTILPHTHSDQLQYKQDYQRLLNLVDKHTPHESFELAACVAGFWQSVAALVPREQALLRAFAVADSAVGMHSALIFPQGAVECAAKLFYPRLPPILDERPQLDDWLTLRHIVAESRSLLEPDGFVAVAPVVPRQPQPAQEATDFFEQTLAELSKELDTARPLTATVEPSQSAPDVPQPPAPVGERRSWSQTLLNRPATTSPARDRAAYDGSTLSFELVKHHTSLSGQIRAMDTVFVPDQCQLLAAMSTAHERSITVWDLSNSALVGSFSGGSTKAVTHVLFHPAMPQYIVTADLDFDVCLHEWRRTESQPARHWRKWHSRVINKLSVVPGQDDRLISCASDNTIKIWSLHSDGSRCASVHANEPFLSFAFLGENLNVRQQQILVGASAYTLRFYRSRTLSPMYTVTLGELRANKTPIHTVVPYPGPESWLLIGADNQYRLYDVERDQTLRCFQARELLSNVKVTGAFSPCGALILSSVVDLRHFEDIKKSAASARRRTGNSSGSAAATTAVLSAKRRSGRPPLQRQPSSSSATGDTGDAPAASLLASSLAAMAAGLPMETDWLRYNRGVLAWRAATGKQERLHFNMSQVDVDLAAGAAPTATAAPAVLSLSVGFVKWMQTETGEEILVTAALDNVVRVYIVHRQ